MYPKGLVCAQVLAPILHIICPIHLTDCLFFCPALFMSFTFSMRGGGEFVLRHGSKAVPHKLADADRYGGSTWR